ncbi:epoxide hydrolase 1 [Metarhizium acridum CQMa 102]|uniref:Epoxide hydrolase 1 n=1 Tax=Metarhizium acridum (strain CQMa 102) TaxID=655827 RepID=E9E6F1_METAQ|nr:epoxide hydrolase 1 [Metarhizium acridum CQMa 102]EFY88555.1 epoxide hydrolase 1 [Metarhizium acridum CQMa 102]
MTEYARLPRGATLAITPFKAHVEEEKLQHFKELLRLSPIGPAVFENTSAGDKYGVQREWLQNAKNTWLNDFDWRKHEDRINSYPNFKTSVKDTAGNTVDVHFLALFSENANAVPIAFFHGWPGSVCGFFDMLDLLRQKFSPGDLPYHVVVPSLPGYAYSSSLPLDVDYGIDMAAGAMHSLMMGLGFGSGYLVHGGDLGSFVSRIMALQYDECKGMHVNMMGAPPLDENPPRSDEEEKALQKALEYIDTASGFALEQGQRPATVGLALSASPLALLSWIGEKFLAWTDGDFPLEKILEIGKRTRQAKDCKNQRGMYQLVGMQMGTDESYNGQVSKMTALQLPYVEKPCGYSLFAGDLFPVPKTWADLSCNLVSFNQHARGGHFAAMENPRALLADVEEYVKKAWSADDSAK